MRTGMVFCPLAPRRRQLSRNSMRWPDSSVTMAFFQSACIEVWRRHRLRLPGTVRTFTAVTFTLGHARSTAALISILLAPGATSKAYLLCSASSVPFSVTRGLRMTSQMFSFATALPLSPAVAARRFALGFFNWRGRCTVGRSGLLDLGLFGRGGRRTRGHGGLPVGLLHLRAAESCF